MQLCTLPWVIIIDSMRLLRFLLVLATLVGPCIAATFPSSLPNNGVVAIVGGASDIVLDEPRARLYLVASALNQIQIFQTNTSPPRLATTVNVNNICKEPISAAMSTDQNSLYVTCYTNASLAIINLNNPTGSAKSVTLPASPEGVAVGGDGRVLITTIGTGTGADTLLIYDPNLPSGQNLLNVFTTPPAPAVPTLPAPNAQIFQAYHSHLQTTNDGKYIVGVNGSGNNRIVFVYEVSYATVLRSRTVTNLSGVLSVAPDGSKFMAGATLFDFQTLSVLAQQNAANAPFSFPSGNSSNFNLQQNQGGSVYSPDGKSLYSAFNIAPVQNPPARANVTQLLFNDPDNMLISLALQLPESLAGKMVITKNGATVYALSQSGFIVLPLSTITQDPLAVPNSPVALLENDQCGVTAQQQMQTVTVKNAGAKSLTVTAQLLSSTSGPGGLGGFGGPGGGGTAGGIIIILPGGIIGGGVGVGGGGGFATPQLGAGATSANSSAATAPLVRTTRNPDGSTGIDFLFDQNAARQPGTVPPHNFLIQSTEAINIPNNIRVFQNNRNSESRGAVIPVATNFSTSEGLIEMVSDTARQRLYITNSGMNRVEVFDLQAQQFLAPIKVGQLPHSMAFGNDGSTLYVGSTGGESISIVNLNTMTMTGRVQFPPLPFNSAFAMITPSVLASSQRGLQVLMSDGTLWFVNGNTAVPRVLNPAVFGTNVRVVPATNPATRTMASTPDGQYVILMTSSGFVYLYSAAQDDFVVGRQVATPPLTGFIGPVAAGPNGSYYLVNNLILNSALTPIGGSPSYTIGGSSSVTTTTGPGGVRPGTPTTTTPTLPNTPPLPGQVPGTTGLPNTATTVTRPVYAVSPVTGTMFARFSQPVLLSNATVATDAGSIELVNVNTGNTVYTTTALEGPLSTVTGNGRASVNARSMVLDSTATNAYVLTASGLTVIPLTPQTATPPTVNNNGVVSNANMQGAIAPGGLVTILGKGLASSATANPPLPTILGGTCVTLNNQPLPLLMTSDGQINAQIPNTMAAGRYQFAVRSLSNQMASAITLQSVSKYAPAVFVLDSKGQPALYHQDGSLVTVDNKASRDEPLKMYATGLGVTTGGRVTPGAGAPGNPLAVTQPVEVFFGNPGYSQAQVIVDWSGLVPGMVGVYEVQLRIPGNHLKGDALPIQVRIGGVFSATTGINVPYVAVD